MDSRSSARPLLCTVYKGSRKQEVYLYVERREGLSRVPGEVLGSMGEMTEVMTFRLTPERRLARADARKVLDDIATRGYYLQLPPMPGAEAQYGA